MSIQDKLVSVQCTCRECGAMFEAAKYCHSKADAASWVTCAPDRVTLCPQCAERKQQADEQEEIRQLTEGLHLPQLQGTKDEVDDAEYLRARTIALLQYTETDKDLTAFILSHDSATWWIE